MNRALDAAKEVKLLPGKGSSGSGKSAGGAPRRRRAVANRTDGNGAAQ